MINLDDYKNNIFYIKKHLLNLRNDTMFLLIILTLIYGLSPHSRLNELEIQIKPLQLTTECKKIESLCTSINKHLPQNIHSVLNSTTSESFSLLSSNHFNQLILFCYKHKNFKEPWTQELFKNVPTSYFKNQKSFLCDTLKGKKPQKTQGLEDLLIIMFERAPHLLDERDKNGHNLFFQIAHTNTEKLCLKVLILRNDWLFEKMNNGTAVLPLVDYFGMKELSFILHYVNDFKKMNPNYQFNELEAQRILNLKETYEQINRICLQINTNRSKKGLSSAFDFVSDEIFASFSTGMFSQLLFLCESNKSFEGLWLQRLFKNIPISYFIKFKPYLLHWLIRGPSSDILGLENLIIILFERAPHLFDERDEMGNNFLFQIISPHTQKLFLKAIEFREDWLFETNHRGKSILSQMNEVFDYLFEKLSHSNNMHLGKTFIQSIQQGNSPVTNFILTHYPLSSFDADEQGETAFTYAIRYGKLDLFHQLIALGHDLSYQNKQGETTLMMALEVIPKNDDSICQEQKLKIAQFIYKNQPEDMLVKKSLTGESALTRSIKYQNLQWHVSSFDLKKIQNMTRSIIHTVYEYGKKNKLDFVPLINEHDSQGSLPLELVIQQDDLETLNLLLEVGGANVCHPSSNYNPLLTLIHLSLYDEQRSWVWKKRQTVLDFIKHYDPSKKKESLFAFPMNNILLGVIHDQQMGYVTHFRPAPLSIVLLETKVAELDYCLLIFENFLCKPGIDVNQKSRFGVPPLSFAVSLKNLDTAREEDTEKDLFYRMKSQSLSSSSIFAQSLIQRKADINLADDFGLTPVMYAVNSEALQTLLNHHPNLNLKDKYGRSFYYYLIQYASIDNIKKVKNYCLKQFNSPNFLRNKILEKDVFNLSLFDYFYDTKKEQLETLLGSEYDLLKKELQKSDLKRVPQVPSDFHLMNHDIWLYNDECIKEQEPHHPWLGCQNFSDFVFIFEKSFFPWDREEHLYDKILGKFFNEIIKYFTDCYQYCRMVTQLNKHLDLMKQKGVSSDMFFIMYAYLRRLNTDTIFNYEPFMQTLLTYSTDQLTSNSLLSKYWNNQTQTFRLAKIKEALFQDSEPKILILLELLSNEEIESLAVQVLNEDRTLPSYCQEDDFKRFPFYLLYQRLAHSYNSKQLRQKQTNKVMKLLTHHINKSSHPSFHIFMNENPRSEIILSLQHEGQSYHWNLKEAKVYGRSLSFPIWINGEEKLFVVKFRKKKETQEEFCDGAVLSVLQEELYFIKDFHQFINTGYSRIGEETILQEIEKDIRRRGLNINRVELEGQTLSFIAPTDYFNYLLQDSSLDFQSYFQGMFYSILTYLFCYKVGLPFSGVTTRSHDQWRIFIDHSYLLVGNYFSNGLGTISDVNKKKTDNNLRERGIRDFGNYMPDLETPVNSSKKLNQVLSSMGPHNRFLSVDFKQKIIDGSEQGIVDELIKSFFIETLLFLREHEDMLKNLTQENFMEIVKSWGQLMWFVYGEGNFEDSNYYRLIQKNKGFILQDWGNFQENPNIITSGYMRDVGRDFPLQNLDFLLTSLIAQLRLDEKNYLKTQKVEPMITDETKQSTSESLTQKRKDLVDTNALPLLENPRFSFIHSELDFFHYSKSA